VAKNKKIEGYQQGAADCRDMQKRMQASGNTAVANAYREAMDANLDRVNELKKGRR